MNRKRWVLPVMLILAMLLVSVSGCVTTQKTTGQAQKETTEKWQFHSIVDVKFVQQYVKMPKTDNVLIIDSRPKRPKFDKGYIPTAVSIPDSQFAKMTDKLPADKAALLIFYCQGPT